MRDRFMKATIGRRSLRHASCPSGPLSRRVKAALLSQGTPHPVGEQSPTSQVQVGQSKHREGASRIFRQASIPHLGEAPQPLHDVKGMLASRTNPRASAVDLSPPLVQRSGRMRAAIDSVANAAALEDLPIPLAPVGAVAVDLSLFSVQQI